MLASPFEGLYDEIRGRKIHICHPKRYQSLFSAERFCHPVVFHAIRSAAFDYFVKIVLFHIVQFLFLPSKVRQFWETSTSYALQSACGLRNGRVNAVENGIAWTQFDFPRDWKPIVRTQFHFPRDWKPIVCTQFHFPRDWKPIVRT